MSTTETTQEAPGSPAWQLDMIRKAEKGLRAAREIAGLPPIPAIVCLCGSTRFFDAFRAANLRLTLAGEIVLSIGCDTKSDADLGIVAGDLAPAKIALDELHKRKIDLADYVLVVSDESGYFGDSTAGEIRYAIDHGKPVRFNEIASQELAEAKGLV